MKYGKAREYILDGTGRAKKESGEECLLLLERREVTLNKSPISITVGNKYTFSS